MGLLATPGPPRGRNKAPSGSPRGARLASGEKDRECQQIGGFGFDAGDRRHYEERS